MGPRPRQPRDADAGGSLALRPVHSAPTGHSAARLRRCGRPASRGRTGSRRAKFGRRRVKPGWKRERQREPPRAVTKSAHPVRRSAEAALKAGARARAVTPRTARAGQAAAPRERAAPLAAWTALCEAAAGPRPTPTEAHALAEPCARQVGAAATPPRGTSSSGPGGEGLPVPRAAAAPGDLTPLPRLFPMLPASASPRVHVPSRSPAAKRDRRGRAPAGTGRAPPAARPGATLRPRALQRAPSAPSAPALQGRAGPSTSPPGLPLGPRAGSARRPRDAGAGHASLAPRLPARRHHRARQPDVVLLAHGPRKERSPGHAAA